MHPPAPSRRLARRSLAVCVGLAFGLLAAEVALRAAGTFTTYSETNFGAYSSVWDRRLANWIHAWEPNTRVEFSSSEFSFTYATNSDGVRDVEHALEAAPGTRRVVVLGDSYAEGSGAEVDRSWPAELERLLRADGTAVEVLDAGVSGSDPFFEYQLLRGRMLRYRPDLVVVSINQTDQVDTLWWGGMQRFQDDGTSRGRPAPRGFAAYRYSHLARWFLHAACGLDREFLTYGSHPRLLMQMQEELLPALEAIDALRVEHPFRLLVLVHPIAVNVRWKDSGYFDTFFAALAARGIEAVDLTEPLHAQLSDLELEEYAWPVDGHFNARGYAAFARAAEPFVRARL